MEAIRNITVKQHSKQRPNSLQYVLTIPPQMAREIGISLEDREVMVKVEDAKIIIEKIK